jgi:hypothetical protein
MYKEIVLELNNNINNKFSKEFNPKIQQDLRNFQKIMHTHNNMLKIKLKCQIMKGLQLAKLQLQKLLPMPRNRWI